MKNTRVAQAPIGEEIRHDRLKLRLRKENTDGEGILEPEATLAEMSMGEQVVEDYVAMRLTLHKHPMAVLRHILTLGEPNQALTE